MNKKSPLSAFLTAILIGLVSASVMRFGMVQAATEVSGLISEDATWTKANSPYTLTGNILVSNGVTLTIEAGTTVNLNTCYIMVNGTLIVRGNSAGKIRFHPGQYGGQIIFTEFSTGWNEQTGSGSIIDNAYFNGTTITVNGGSPVISNNKFYASQVKVNGGSPILSDNNISGGKTVGFEVQYFTPITVDGGSPVISKNYIHNAEIGIEIKQGNPYIYGNNVSGATPNLLANTGIIERNYFSGIIEIGNVTVKNNTITSIEVQGSSSPTITYNNVVSIRLSSSTNVDAAKNWWGTIDTAEIDQKIWDYNDDYNLGKVNYTPFLTEPNAQAMPDPNAPIPTPLPEQTPTPTPSQERQQPVQFEMILGVAIAVAVIGAGLVLLFYFIKRRG